MLLFVEAIANQINNSSIVRRYEMEISAHTCDLTVHDMESTLTNFLNVTSDDIHVETLYYTFTSREIDLVHGLRSRG